MLLIASASKFVLRRLFGTLGFLPSSKPAVAYHKNFRRATRLLAALDAGTLTVRNLPTQILRNVASTFLFVYYILNSDEAVVANSQFRTNVGVEMIRTCFQKGRHPVLTFIARASRPKLGIDGRRFEFSRPDLPPVSAYLYFRGSNADLAKQPGVVLSFPGGGFVAMSPRDHSDYLCEWAHSTGLPVLSVDYRKAPENPYPCGLDDCFTVYKAIIESNGGAIGINKSLVSAESHSTPSSSPKSDVKVVLVGDSGGGNLCAAATLRALRLNIRLPTGVHLIYPALNFDISGFRIENKKIAVASQASFVNDPVLPYSFLIECARAYLGQGSDPVHDCELSPLKASDEHLAKFPPTCIHVGTFDPLCDDSHMFAARLKAANPNRYVELEEIESYSHGYLHVLLFLPEARAAVAKGGDFFRRMILDS